MKSSMSTSSGKGSRVASAAINNVIDLCDDNVFDELTTNNRKQQQQQQQHLKNKKNTSSTLGNNDIIDLYNDDDDDDNDDDDDDNSQQSCRKKRRKQPATEASAANRRRIARHREVSVDLTVDPSQIKLNPSEARFASYLKALGPFRVEFLSGTDGERFLKSHSFGTTSTGITKTYGGRYADNNSSTTTTNVRKLHRELVQYAFNLPATPQGSIFVRVNENRLDLARVLITGKFVYTAGHFFNFLFGFIYWYQISYHD
jgi:hypothetical protein